MLEVTLPYFSPSPGTKDKAVSFESDINNGWLFLFCFLGFRDLSRGGLFDVNDIQVTDKAEWKPDFKLSLITAIIVHWIEKCILKAVQH